MRGFNIIACGNHDAAENAAIIYTFMGCSKLAQVDVHKWLNFKSILTIRGLLMAYHLMRHYLYPHF